MSKAEIKNFYCLNFCLGGTGRGMQYGSGSRSGSEKWNEKKVKNERQRPTPWEIMLLLTLERPRFSTVEKLLSIVPLRNRSQNFSKFGTGTGKRKKIITVRFHNTVFFSVPDSASSSRPGSQRPPEHAGWRALAFQNRHRSRRGWNRECCAPCAGWSAPPFSACPPTAFWCRGQAVSSRHMSSVWFSLGRTGPPRRRIWCCNHSPHQHTSTGPGEHCFHVLDHGPNIYKDTKP